MRLAPVVLYGLQHRSVRPRQTDVIYYGADLRRYLACEFGDLEYVEAVEGYNPPHPFLDPARRGGKLLTCWQPAYRPAMESPR